MAINFLNTVDLNSIQIENIVPENATAGTIGAGVLGQMYFDTARDTMMQYVANDPANPGNPGYIEIGTTSAVESLIAGAGIGISAAIGNITVRNTGLISVLDGTYIDLTKQGGGDNTQLTADLSAVDGTSVLGTRFLSKDNTWDVPAFDQYTHWTLAGDNATTQNISSEDTASFLGDSLKISTAVSVTDTLTISHDLQAQTDTTSTAAPGYLGTFTAIDTVTRDTTGHVTGVNVKTVTIPASDDTQYTLPVTPLAGNQARASLTRTDGTVDSTVDFIGTAGRIAITSQDQNNGSVTIDFPDDVTIVDDLTVGGIITQLGTGITTGVNDGALTASTNLLLTANNTAIKIGMQVTGIDIPVNITVVTVTDAKNFVLSGAITITNGITITFEEVNSFAAPLDMNNNRLHEVKTGVLGTDGVNLGQVQSLVAGIGVFKGGYNATTGLTVPDGLEIEGANNIALDKGDYFVVTTAGSAFFSLALEAGDFIFAETAITANSSPPVGDYIVVRADDNVAGAGATDGATQKGVSGFDSANFTVSSNGWVQIKSLSRLNGRKQVLDDGGSATPATSPVERDFLNGFTTFEIDLADASLFGTGALAEDVTVEVTQHVSPYQTVYADVTRSGSASMSIIFSGNVAVDTYRVLLEYV